MTYLEFGLEALLGRRTFYHWKKKSDKPCVIVLIEFVLTCKTSGFIFTDSSVFCGRKFTLGMFQHTPEIFVLSGRKS